MAIDEYMNGAFYGWKDTIFAVLEPLKFVVSFMAFFILIMFLVVVFLKYLASRRVVDFQTKHSVLMQIRELANYKGVDIGLILEELLINGLNRFGVDSRTQDPDALIAMYETKEKGYPDGEFQRFGLLIDRKTVIKVRLQAVENEIDPVRFSSLLLIEALSRQGCETTINSGFI